MFFRDLNLSLVVCITASRQKESTLTFTDKLYLNGVHVCFSTNSTISTNCFQFFVSQIFARISSLGGGKIK